MVAFSQNITLERVKEHLPENPRGEWVREWMDACLSAVDGVDKEREKKEIPIFPSTHGLHIRTRHAAEVSSTQKKWLGYQRS